MPDRDDIVAVRDDNVVPLPDRDDVTGSGGNHARPSPPIEESSAPPIEESSAPRYARWEEVPVLCWLLAIIGGIVCGYSSSVIGGMLALMPFLSKFSRKIFLKNVKAYTTNFCPFVSIGLQAFVGSMYAMGMGSCLISYMTRRQMGIRPMMITGSICFSVGAGLLMINPRIWSQLTGRLIMGIAYGLIRQNIPLILEEFVPEENRNTIDAVFFSCIPLGSTVASIVAFVSMKSVGWSGTFWEKQLGFWRLGYVGLLVFAAVLCLLCWFIPKTSRNIEIQGQNWRVLLKREHSPELIIRSLSKVIPGIIGGINVYVNYAPLALESVTSKFGEDDGSFIIPIAYGFLTTISGMIQPAVINFFGRRSRFGMVATLLMLFAMAASWPIFAVGVNPFLNMAQTTAVVAVVCAIVFSIAHGILTGPRGWLDFASAERLGPLLELELELFMNLATNLGSLYIICSLGREIIVFYIVVTVLLGIVFMILVPSGIWQDHWFWYKFFRIREVIVV